MRCQEHRLSTQAVVENGSFTLLQQCSSACDLQPHHVVASRSARLSSGRTLACFGCHGRLQCEVPVWTTTRIPAVWVRLLIRVTFSLYLRRLPSRTREALACFSCNFRLQCDGPVWTTSQIPSVVGRCRLLSLPYVSRGFRISFRKRNGLWLNVCLNI